MTDFSQYPLFNLELLQKNTHLASLKNQFFKFKQNEIIPKPYHQIPQQNSLVFPQPYNQTYLKKSQDFQTISSFPQNLRFKTNKTKRDSTNALNSTFLKQHYSTSTTQRKAFKFESSFLVDGNTKSKEREKQRSLKAYGSEKQLVNVPDLLKSVADTNKLGFNFHDQQPKVKEQLSQIKLKDFHRIRQLGKGKFGQVYLVRHYKTNFICAMKIVSKKVLIEQKVEEQISRQIRIHSQLHHQNIIQFYGFFSDYNNFYILLEYAVGGSVYGLIRKQNRLEENQVLKIIKELCQGVKYIHDYGYIQRDIKPQNTMLQFDTVKICDFGWSIEYKMRRQIAGTPLYYSPQMVRKDLYDGSVDVWAIGMMTYQLIMGRIPFSIFTQDNLNEILYKQIQFPNYIDVSDQCKDFIQKALKKYQVTRWSVRQLLNLPLMKNTKIDFDYNIYEEVKQL